MHKRVDACWWLGELENLDAGEGRNVPTEIGYCRLQYMLIGVMCAICFGIYLLFGGFLVAVLGFASSAKFLWLFPAILIPILVIGLAIRLAIIQPWTCKADRGAPSVVFVYRAGQNATGAYQSPHSDREGAVELEVFKEQNESYYTRASKDRLLTKAAMTVHSGADALGSGADVLGAAGI